MTFQLHIDRLLPLPLPLTFVAMGCIPRYLASTAGPRGRKTQEHPHLVRRPGGAPTLHCWETATLPYPRFPRLGLVPLVGLPAVALTIASCMACVWGRLATRARSP